MQIIMIMSVTHVKNIVKRGLFVMLFCVLSLTVLADNSGNSADPFIVQTFPEAWGILDSLQYFTFTFNEEVYQVNGKSIILYNAESNTPYQQFIIPDSSSITGSGTKTIKVLLDSLPVGDYYVWIEPGSFKNAFGYLFAGITNPNTWRISILENGKIVTNTNWDEKVAIYTDIIVNGKLTIAPGTDVKMMDYFGFDVSGELYAEGTSSDSIRFFAGQAELGWNGIRTNSVTRLKYCTIQDGKAKSGTGPSGYGGAVFVESAQNKVHIEHCTFLNNHADEFGGAVFCEFSNVAILNSVFKNNHSGGNGGAISYYQTTGFTLVNNLFINNSAAKQGGALWFGNYDSEPTYNNTFSGNHARYGGAVSCVGFSSPRFVNSVFYGDTADHGNEISVGDTPFPGKPDFKFCLVQGGKEGIYGNYSGQYDNNIDADPMFLGAGNTPYKIAKSSPCANAGDPATTVNQVGDSDIIDLPRFQNGRIDMGAYETKIFYDDSTGSAIWFSGENQYLNTANNVKIDLSDNFTIEAWIKPASFDSLGGIISKFHHPSSDGYFLRLTPEPPFTGIDFSGQLTRTGILEANKWYHIAATYHQGEGCVYVNGVKQTLTGSAPTIKKNSDPLTIGVDYLSFPTFFNGLIDEVRIWDTVLDAETIRENMYLNLSEKVQHLAAYWQFNTGSGTLAKDQQEISNMQLNNMGESNWKPSHIPFGKGKSSTKTVSGTGVVHFDSTGVKINFFEKSGSNNIVVATIDTTPDVVPVQCDEPFKKQYFIINSFDDGTFNSNITFTLQEELSDEDANNLGGLSLYRRIENSGQCWERIAVASLVDVNNHQITFDSINTFGQFITGRYNDTVPPEIVSTYPESWGILQRVEKLQLHFDEVVEPVNGKQVAIMNANNNTLVSTIVISSDNVTGSGTGNITVKLNPALSQEGNYYVLVQDGAFNDLSGNPFEGISSPEQWKISILSNGQLNYNLTVSGNIAVYTDIHVNKPLKIEPGTNIKLKGRYRFEVSWSLEAVGSSDKPIRFFAEDTVAGWKGLSGGNFKLDYCIFENANKLSDEQFGYGGVLYLWPTDHIITINHCFFKNNHADGYGGAIYSFNTNVVIKNCIFSNNTSAMGGAAAFQYFEGYNANLKLINNLFVNNRAGVQGGAVLFWRGVAGDVYNNTFSGNEAEFGGAVSSIQKSHPAFRNCVFYDNQAVLGRSINVMHENDPPGRPNFYYSMVQGGKTGIYGDYQGNYENNMDVNPLFNGTGDFPYKLSRISPCIDKGDPSTTPSQVGDYDLAHEKRFSNERIDMGAYETAMIPDDFAGNTLLFDGSSQYARVPASASLNLTDNFTVEAWIKPNSFNWDAGIVSKYQSPGAKGYYLRLGSESGYTAIAFCGSVTPTGVLQPGKWYHVAGVRKNGKNTIYINGEKQVVSGSPEDIAENDDPLTIGVDYLSSPRYFDGLIDEVRVWKQARSADEIRENMYLRIPQNTPELISYYQFNDSTGASLIDIMANNSGVLENMSDSSWKKSTIPFGPGKSNTEIVSGNTTVSFPGLRTRMDIINHSGIDSITVTLLDTLPNQMPESEKTIPGGGYRIINPFGTGSLMANLTLKVDYKMTDFDELNPGNFLLFVRDNNSDSAWSMIKHAVSVNAGDSTVTFDSISRFGQLLVTRNIFEKYPGYAVEFDTSAGFIQLANEHHFDFQNSFTLETWLYTEKMSADFQTILSKGNAWKLRMIYSDDAILLEFSINEGPSQVSATLLTDTATMLHKWNHISCVYNNISSNSISIYLNGKQGGTAASNPLLQNNDPVTVGKWFKGKLDEIRFWKTARTEQQIRENINLAPNYPVTGLLSYLQLNEGKGRVTKDVYGGNTGSLSNMNTSGCWTVSPIPFGGGNSNTRTENFGIVNFLGTGVSADYSSSSGASVTVSRIDTLPNLLPGNNSDLFDRQYWVIRRYGGGDFNASLTFKVGEEIRTGDVNAPGQIKLYYRSANSVSNWELLKSASEVDLDNNTVTFDNISDYGQFMIGRDKPFSGYPGKALRFDGVNDYVNGDGIDTSLSAFTIELWVKHDTLPDKVQRYVTLNPEMAVLRYDGTIYGGKDELHFYIKNANGHLSGIRVDNVLKSGEWMFVAATYDGSVMKLYLNGKLLQSKTVNAELYKPDGSFRFSSNGEPMNGQLDEIRIWKNARTESEIREDMHLVFDRSQKDLLNYWQFNQDGGGFAVDTVTGVAGKLHNMSTPACWVESTIPAGMGSSETKIVENDSVLDFSGESVSLNVTSVENSDSITATRINISPNLTPLGNYQTVDTGYWVVSKFGEGTFNSNPAFSISNVLTLADSYSPSRFKLFRRTGTSDGEWQEVTSADSIIGNTVYFSNVNRFGQFLIAKADNDIFSPGNCLQFDGIDDYVSIPANEALNTTNFTVEFWMSTKSPSKWVGIIDKGRESLSNWYFLTGDDGQTEGVIFGIGTGSNPVVEIGKSWNDENWHHVAGTYNGTTMKLYVDGNLVSSRQVVMLMDSNNIHLGNKRGNDGWFKGRLDEVRIWNRALNNTEIRIQMHKTLSGNEDGLTAYWQFDESSSDTLHDATGNHNGLLHNMENNNRIESTAPVPYYTATSGNWEDTTTWAAGQGVPEHSWSRIRVKHDVTLNSNKTAINIFLLKDVVLTISVGDMLVIKAYQ